MVIDRRKTYNSLKKKGFIDSDRKSKDHLHLDFFYKGKFAFYTKISHGSRKDITEPLIHQMAEQCKLNEKMFADLAKCPLSKQKYLAHLVKNGIFD